MQVLSCKQRCALELATNTDQPFDDFLPSHFNYLQFSYYNSKTDRRSFSIHTPPHPPLLEKIPLLLCLCDQVRTWKRPSSVRRPSCCSTLTTR